MKKNSSLNLILLSVLSTSATPLNSWAATESISPSPPSLSGSVESADGETPDSAQSTPASSRPSTESNSDSSPDSSSSAPSSGSVPEAGNRISVPRRKVKIFSYHDVRPNWGMQLETSLNPFGGAPLGGTALIPEQGTNPAFGFNLAFEYQPAFLQGFGVLGVGPRVGIYPIFQGGVTSSVASIYSLGGQIRYQARYFRRQLIVPMASYSYESYRYSFTTGQSGNFLANGPSAGVWILLNTLDPSSAADFYIDNGVARTYLVAEARFLSDNDPVVRFSNASYYFGIRFEF